MACAATARGDQMLCSLCGVQWDRNDPDPPACKRQMRENGGAGSDPILRPAEVKALRQCVADWQPRRRSMRGGGGFGRKGEAKIPFAVAKVLVTFHLAFYSQYQSLRATPYGEQWLARRGKLKPAQ